MYFGTGLVFAGDSTTQIVTYSVNSINEISVTGAPTLTIIAPAAGSLLADAEDSTTTYAITTNGSGLKITGSLADAMPTGVDLRIHLIAPSVGASAGVVTFTAATAVTLVTGITQVAESGLGITYTMSASLAAGAIPSATKVVTLTIVAGS
ncbi:MAG: hypothetical protein CVV41_14675 [Candidatus Riflebacteria bacterium HGW-Riflebacteria-1]|nr:MAG: hypothetical protein CVV41_14675 [Candidatus Riflebacteria bacterium HGW-Riflebacteria-1]